MQNRNNKNKFSPNSNLTAKEHRPLRWLVRQFFTEDDPETGQFYRHEVVTGYHTSLENIPGMAPVLAQALDSINRFGGELYACYGDGQPLLVNR
jgi:hypothetical protein